MPEEQTFGVLVKVMHQLGLRDMFRENFEHLQMRLFQLDRLIENYLPDIWAHFAEYGIESHMWVLQKASFAFSFRQISTTNRMTKQLICEITKFCLLLRGCRIKQLGISVHCVVNKRHATILCRPIFLFPLFQIYHSFHWLHSGRQKGIILGWGSYVICN